MDRNVVNNKVIVAVIVGAALFVRHVLTLHDSQFVKVDASCLKCLEYAYENSYFYANCNDRHYGPLRISRHQWLLGKSTFPNITEDSDAFKECAGDIHCSEKAIEQYMNNFGKDCNKDDHIDCLDFALLSIHGPNRCHKMLDRTKQQMLFIKQYKKCVNSITFNQPVLK